MIRCKVCKKLFVPRKLSKYEIKSVPVGLQVMVEKTKVFECFDCPRCGCQNIVNIREV